MTHFWLGKPEKQSNFLYWLYFQKSSHKMSLNTDSSNKKYMIRIKLLRTLSWNPRSPQHSLPRDRKRRTHTRQNFWPRLDSLVWILPVMRSSFPQDTAVSFLVKFNSCTGVLYPDLQGTSWSRSLITSVLPWQALHITLIIYNLSNRKCKCNSNPPPW